VGKYFIIGNRGNMGQRYGAILKDLGHEVFGRDLHDTNMEDLSKMDGFIVTTPTDSHADDIEGLICFKKPILCEKPVIKDLVRLREIIGRLGDTPFQMVNQYRFLCGHSHGPTFYNFCKHGGDGIFWDCINVIGLAERDWHVSDTSPVWQCTINGQHIPQERMDFAYCYMIQDWLANPRGDLGYILQAHDRASKCTTK
jgi:hypothetical protein